MQNRISPETVLAHCPRLATHLIGLGKTDPHGGISATLKHLVKLRVSQLNHCCYCQHMHSQEARQDGEQQQRLDVLPAWREAPCFSEKERAALAWAESLTLLNQAPVDDRTYQDALAHFGEFDLIELTSIILEINSWNRISVGFQFSPAMETTNSRGLNR